MIIIPQITVSTDDAKLKALQTNLNIMRNAIELYYHQHNQTYPGAIDHVTLVAPVDVAAAATAFNAQLTTYTEASGFAKAGQSGLDRTHLWTVHKGGNITDKPLYRYGRSHL